MIAINKKSNFAFTMVETLVVLSILALVAVIALAGYLSLNADAKAKNLANVLKSTMQMAKSEAETQGTNIVVCAITSSTPTASPPFYSCNNASTVWQNGWMIVNTNTNPNTLIKVFTPTGADGVSITPANNMIFLASGFLAAPSSFTFTIQPTGCSTGFCATVNLAGQTILTRRNCPFSCP